MQLFIILSTFFSCKDDQEIKKGNVKDTSNPILDEGYKNDWGKWLSLSHTSDNFPAVSYYDSTTGGLGFAIYKTNEDGDLEWHNEEIDGYANEQGLDIGDRGKYSSLAITSTDTPWITYYDVGLKNLRYATKVEGQGGDLEWFTGSADSGGGSSPDAGLYSSMTLVNDNPVVAHYDRGKGNLRLAAWNGSSFSGEVIDEGNNEEGEDKSDVGKFSSIALDSNENIYIAYYDQTLGNLKVAWQNASGWQIEVVDTGDSEVEVRGEDGTLTMETVLGNAGEWPSIAIDASGKIGISYLDVKNQDLKYASRNTTSTEWTIEVVDTGDLVGADSALSLQGGYPTIIYFDGRFNNIKVARKSSSTWSLEKLDGDNEALGYHNEIKVIDNRHYVGCYNYTKKKIWFSQLD